MINITIDGRDLTCKEGQTILEAATAGGIEIPTLCHDERVKIYAACGLCLVEAENSPKLMRACATTAQKDMKIKTNTPRVITARRAALELLLSDHKGDCSAPCKSGCPAHTDCQGYVGLIANGEFDEAAKVIKEKIPLPASIGRVCPHPCEEKCRRALVEEPVNIAGLKTFAAENSGFYIPEIKPDTGKKIAIVGGGPGGLTAAYFLRAEGHAVTVYEAMPKMGGMLYYGVPEYRLPKAVLDKETEAVARMGITFKNNTRIGKDVTLDELRKNSDAVIVAIGAWEGVSLGCPGEQTPGVIGGIEFLRDVFSYKNVIEGKRVAVIGGGDTAMDACRTAVRLGAAEVYDVYRRSLSEMPANKIEIEEAGEEGVIFKYLHNPAEIVGGNSVTHLRLQKMQLGEPDESGRRAPVPIPGAEEMLAVDTVIIMIGQTVATKGFEEITLTRKHTIQANEETFETNLPGVFAIGDATNKGASIAIEAIGEAGRCAKVVLGYITDGNITPAKKEVLVVDTKTEEDFKTEKKAARANVSVRAPDSRRNDFKEVNTTLGEAEAKSEAMRCLECGCADYFECKLYRYANMFDAVLRKEEGLVHSHASDTSNPHLYRNMNKCILCGLCVRVCDEVMGKTALGLVNRGFETVVKPELDQPLADTNCNSCGLCVAMCPTGALGETPPIAKQVPVRTQQTGTVCEFCGVGCDVNAHTRGRLHIKNAPAANTLLCGKGRFGFGDNIKRTRVKTSLIRKGNDLSECSFDEAAAFVTEGLKNAISKYGADAVGISVSDKLSNEEIAGIKSYAGKLKIENIFTFSGTKSGLAEVTGSDKSTCGFDALETADVVVLCADDIMESHGVAGIFVKKAVEKGAKLVTISKKGSQADEWAEVKITAPYSDALKQFAEAVKGGGSGGIKKAAELYCGAKKPVLVFDQGALSAEEAKCAGEIAKAAGHIDGVIQLKPGVNSQGLSDAGIKSGAKSGIKALLVFGEEAPDLSGLEFLAVIDAFMTKTANTANCVIPAAAFLESSGTYTNTTGVVKKSAAAVKPLAGKSNTEIINGLVSAWK